MIHTGMIRCPVSDTIDPETARTSSSRLCAIVETSGVPVAVLPEEGMSANVWLVRRRSAETGRRLYASAGAAGVLAGSAGAAVALLGHLTPWVFLAACGLAAIGVLLMVSAPQVAGVPDAAVAMPARLGEALTLADAEEIWAARTHGAVALVPDRVSVRHLESTATCEIPVVVAPPPFASDGAPNLSAA